MLADVTPDMRLAREETFGPVAPVFRFKDEAEVDPARQRHASSASPPTSTRATSAASGASPRRSNTAWSAINTGLISTELAPFGGVKESGLGREGSRHGIEEFVEIKYVLMGGLDR